MTAVLNRTDHAVSKVQQDDRHVHVTKRADSGINHGASQSEERVYFATDQKAGHIEVVDGHIAEHAARYLEIVNWRRIGVIAHDMEQVQLTDLPLYHSLSHAAIIGIETPVEADLQFDTSSFHRIQRLVYGWEIERNWFFAENVLTLLRRLLDDARMGI